ncbi:hypothetical protein LH29_18190 [Draconibacterium sediminis]|uniref:DUF4412 domain-containing protein n=1 Tax=Draconibacterium sediminis TaxID=1544798 RepID=A0A0D8J691_9BACT|nr:hypothetical protein LH29_18190 [Draconibacterium sediminis]
MFCVLCFSLQPNAFAQNEFEGKVVYRYSYPNGYKDEAQGFVFTQDSLIDFAVKADTLLAKKVDIYGSISQYYLKEGEDSYLYNPVDSFLLNYDRLPNVFYYQFIRKFRRKEEILGYTCTKLEYQLGPTTTVYFWVADDIPVKNYGSFFNFISNDGKLVLKRQLVPRNEGYCNVYEAISIDTVISEKDFQFPPMPESLEDD